MTIILGEWELTTDVAELEMEIDLNMTWML